MYCVIQEVKLKNIDSRGHSKGIEPYTVEYNGIEHYKYRHSYEYFERDIKKAYKISIHKSYRENGKVKKKQYSICTMGYYSIIDFGTWVGNYCNIEAKAELIGVTYEELDEIIYKKLNPIINRVEAEYQQTEEYKTVKAYRKQIEDYNNKKSEFDKIYGNGTYEQCYNVYNELVNADRLEEIKMEYNRRKEYEQKSYEQYYKRSYSGNSSYYSNPQSNYNEEEKKLLKKIYKKLAMEFHPDRNLDSQEEAQKLMTMTNKLKEQWGI